MTAPELADPFGLVGTTLDAQYRVDQAVGEGGFGVVYRGWHRSMEQPIAIKALKVPFAEDRAVQEALFAKFKDEAKLLYTLSQASLHIVRSMDFGAVTAPTGVWTPYMILEWLEGVSLADDLSERRRRRMPGRSLDEALTLLEPAAEGLGVAHQRRVAHRDIKPANFFLLKGGSGPRVKVLDFGIAKIIRDGDGPGTRSPFTSFTWLYAAPEQLDPRLGASGLATDVYAFALLLTELLTDRPPTAERDVVALLKAATDPTVRPTPRHRGASVPDAFEVACRRALAVDPRARFASIPELWSALVAGRRASTPASRAAPPAYPPPGGPPYPPPLRPSYGQPSAVSSQAPSPAAMQVAQGPSQAPMAQAPTQLAPSGHFSVASASRQPAGPFSSPAASAMSPPPMSPPPGARVYAHPRRLVPQASSSWPVVVTVIALVLGGVLLVTCSALQASC